MLRFTAQTGESTGIKHRAGPGVADVGAGESLACLERWGSVLSSSAQGEGRFEDIAVGIGENSRRTHFGGQGSAAGGGDLLDGMVNVFACFF